MESVYQILVSTIETNTKTMLENDAIIMCSSKENGEESLEIVYGPEISGKIDDEGNEVYVPRINFDRISSLNVQGKGISQYPSGVHNGSTGTLLLLQLH